MGSRFITIDRQSPMLMPPDLRDWLPENHIARFIVELVEGFGVSSFIVNDRGTGSEQYPPSMLAERDQKRRNGQKPRGRKPKPPPETPPANRQYNFTDSDSTIMKAGSGTHFEQCYNAQAAVETVEPVFCDGNVANRPLKSRNPAFQRYQAVGFSGSNPSDSRR